MKSTYTNILWGAVLILGGGLFLAQNLGYFDSFSPQFWVAAFAGASLLFFASYFLNGIRHWGWLFPASISAALALTIGLSELGFNDATIGAPILASVGLPFVVAFALNPRQHWWALIPAWVMAVLTLIVLAATRLPGEAIAALVLFGIAIPFLVVYLADRERWWALIPAFTLTVVGLIPLLANRLSGEHMGAFILLSLALPFLVVYLASPRSWWAIIPSGVMGSIGLGLLLGNIELFGAYWTPLISAVMFLGWSATFGLLWFRRESQPTEWAKYPALVMLGAAFLAMILGSGMQQFWPLALIAVGILVLWTTLRPRQSV
ncbi:MAG: hypothetical protein P8Z00_00540 [Anaerolineales bacterium]|jgi:hypothetical protein